MRAQDVKYLGYGLGVGAALASIALALIFFFMRVTASNTPEPAAHLPIPTALAQTAAAFTSTPTMLPLPTQPPLPTATQTSTDMLIASGEIAIVGPLTREQHVQLYEASLFYISPTYQESKKMSVAINQARFSDPSTTCGPLSIAILQRGGILREDLIPHDFFLLNPYLGKDRQILKATFPAISYQNTRYKTKLNKFDWAVDPLMPGDFVYIYMGDEGNFEHMLVVNRVDYQGRAYSVTNFNTDQGFIIDEVMLYDPKDPKAGIFAQWTKREKQLLGSTGFAGFEVWRLKGQPQ